MRDIGGQMERFSSGIGHSVDHQVKFNWSGHKCLTHRNLGLLQELGKNWAQFHFKFRPYFWPALLRVLVSRFLHEEAPRFQSCTDLGRTLRLCTRRLRCVLHVSCPKARATLSMSVSWNKKSTFPTCLPIVLTWLVQNLGEKEWNLLSPFRP